jgi:hypothetical protein
VGGGLAIEFAAEPIFERDVVAAHSRALLAEDRIPVRIRGLTMSNPDEWHIARDKEGFYIEDEYGEEVRPQWLPRSAAWRAQGYRLAKIALDMTRARSSAFNPAQRVSTELTDLERQIRELRQAV